MLDTYKYKVDFSEVEDFMEIHEVLKHDLGLPDYYGGNTDALWDCLTDMLGDSSHIEIVGFENVEKRYKVEWEGIVKILKKAKHACNDEYSSTFVVTLVHEDGTHEEIE
jgi:ribonuclease inhibitor